MWSLVDSAKEGRSIVLTTHSMEEADALCGRLGIMAHGRLQCVGTSLHLKGKFGSGFKVEVTTKVGKSSEAAAFCKELLPNCTSLKTHAPNSLCFQFEPGAVQISEVFDRFSARPDSAGVAEWALHQASMEEVFLLIAHRAAEAHAAATSKAKDGAVDV